MLELRDFGVVASFCDTHSSLFSSPQQDYGLWSVLTGEAWIGPTAGAHPIEASLTDFANNITKRTYPPVLTSWLLLCSWRTTLSAWMAAVSTTVNSNKGKKA